eukprot:12924118-Prorocentrum_lima.AAC.1
MPATALEGVGPLIVAADQQALFVAIEKELRATIGDFVHELGVERRQVDEVQVGDELRVFDLPLPAVLCTR